jgi:CRISPR type III-A-associated RAMP protein Csm4
MNPGLVVKLRPVGPWRIGPNSGARNRVDVIYHSDSLYSAVTLAMERLGRLEDWLNATARAEISAVCFSSCFPFLDEIGFVVPPRTMWPPSSPALMSARVRWKSARFVPLGIVQALASGQTLVESHWSVDGPSECLVPAGRPGPFRTGVRWGAAVDRLTGASERHSTACLEFRPGAGLWTIVSFRDDAAHANWSDPVKTAFRLLADTGFGGERSRGWGRSEAPEFIDGVLPGMILGAHDPMGTPLPAPAEEPAPEPPPVLEPPPEEPPEPERGQASEMAPPEIAPLASEPAAASFAGGTPLPAFAAMGTPLPEGAEIPAAGTPLPEGAEIPAAGTPLPEGAEIPAAGTPLPEGAEIPATGTPLPEGAEIPATGTPLPEGAEIPAAGTPLPEGAEIPATGTPLPEGAEIPAAGTPLPEGAEIPAAGTPLPGAAETPAMGTPLPAAEPPAPIEPVAPLPEPAPAPGTPLPPESAGPPGPERPHWLLSLFTPAPGDAVDWRRGNYAVIARGGRVESRAAYGELKKQVHMIAEGSVVFASADPHGAAADVAPDGFAHPVYRAGFAVSIPLPEVR